MSWVHIASGAGRRPLINGYINAINDRWNCIRWLRLIFLGRSAKGPCSNAEEVSFLGHWTSMPSPKHYPFSQFIVCTTIFFLQVVWWLDISSLKWISEMTNIQTPIICIYDVISYTSTNWAKLTGQFVLLFNLGKNKKHNMYF
jgi:hypothetical protein